MNIRWKFFFVLLGASVVPLLVVSILVAVLADNIERNVIRETRAELTERASTAMLNMARNYATGMMQDIQSLSVIAYTLKREAERLAAVPAPAAAAAAAAADDTAVLFSSDFDPELPFPPDLKEFASYTGKPRGMMMQTASGLVSFGSMSFHVPGGNPDARQKQRAARLAGLLPVLRDVRGVFGDYIYRMFVGLEDGLSGTYPGLGEIPPAYDPRERPWYRAAVERDDITWTSPVVDAVTGRLTLTISIPLRGADGRLLGVAGLDILMQEGLQAHSVISSWSKDLEMMLVYRDPAEGENAPINVVGRTLRDAEGRQMWRMMQREAPFPMPEGRTLDNLRSRMSHRHADVMELEFNDEPSLLAYAPITDQLTVVIITPRSVIQEVPDTISNMLTESDEAVNLVVSMSLILVMLGAFVISLLASRATTRPLLDIVQAARRLSQGDWSVHIPARLGDERDEVIQAFNEMGPKLSKQIQIQQALDVAHEVQSSLLPAEAPVFEGWDISGRTRYCDETGGDYYDYITWMDGQEPALSVVLGDVSGHGLPSALLMATGRSLLRGQADSLCCTARRVERVNAILSADVNGTGRFITLFVLDIRQRSRQVRWVRAGHDPAMVYDPATDVFSLLQGCGLPLGVVPDATYNAEETTLPENAVVLIGTDGIWEAVNAEGEMFGKDRLQELLRSHAHLCAHEISKAVLDAVDTFCQDAPRMDDVTLVVLKPQQHGCTQSAPAVPQGDTPPEEASVHVRLTSALDIPALAEAVQTLCDSTACSRRVRFSFTLAVDELVTNVFEHGAADGVQRRVDAWFWLQDGFLRARLEDNGNPFNCTKAAPPELNVPLEKRKKPVGGLGIHLVKQYMDDFRYTRKKDNNIIVLGKRLDNGSKHDDERSHA
jgi:sigma-B regulation protein RsbU (phosphoserine phosphatase)